jgi:hypothetical protein
MRPPPDPVRTPTLGAVPGTRERAVHIAGRIAQPPDTAPWPRAGEASVLDFQAGNLADDIGVLVMRATGRT